MTRVKRNFTVVADAAGGLGEGVPYDFPSVLAFEIENIGANALDSLILQFKNAEDADWFDYAVDAELVDTDSGFYYQNPAATVLHNLPAGAKVNYAIRVLGAYAVRWKAVCAAGTTIVFDGVVQSQEG